MAQDSIIRPILRMGDPFLTQIAAEVTPVPSAVLDRLLADMLATMKALNGAGLAAPQIGVSLRVVVFGGFKSLRYPESADIPFTQLINPKITPLSTEMVVGWEGCLSVPGLRGRVSRHRHIRYTGVDAQGLRIDRSVSDFHARVVQHECDHLDGILFPQRLVDIKDFGFEEALQLREDYPYKPKIDTD